MRIKVFVVVVLVLSVLLVTGAFADRTLPRPGGKGYVMCLDSYTVLNQQNEVLQCILAAPLTYDVFGGTDVCPENAAIKFSAKGSVVGCKAVVKGKH